jgi:hypothetical protein
LLQLTLSSKVPSMEWEGRCQRPVYLLRGLLRWKQTRSEWNEFGCAGIEI